jgi:hypothetical protein
MIASRHAQPHGRRKSVRAHCQLSSMLMNSTPDMRAHNLLLHLNDGVGSRINMKLLPEHRKLNSHQLGNASKRNVFDDLPSVVLLCRATG